MGRLLVIEDDLTLRPLWEAVAKRNFGSDNIDWGVSAEEGRRLIQNSLILNDHYQLVVADLFLAGSDTGLDFIYYIKSLGLDTPILLVSAVEEQELAKTFSEIRETVFILSKPLNIVKCERVIESMLHTPTQSFNTSAAL